MPNSEKISVILNVARTITTNKIKDKIPPIRDIIFAAFIRLIIHLTDNTVNFIKD